jgi:hypothetical protein
MELDQVVTWLKQQMILQELKALAGRPTLKRRRQWRRQKAMLARVCRALGRD